MQHATIIFTCIVCGLLLGACGGEPPSSPVAPVAPPAKDTIVVPPPDTTTVQNGFEQVRKNGRVLMEGEKVNGKRHGVWTSYTSDGRVRSRNTYNNGLLHGETVVFRESGVLYYTGGYANDKQVGEWKFYGPDGNLEKTVKY